MRSVPENDNVTETKSIHVNLSPRMIAAKNIAKKGFINIILLDSVT